ncbi:ABC transporter permease [Parachryseolinea silvisoli]|uniref:ABC transporter permease n=1 Tax=Parachryseolinea silvisoli TaxID=2873601 RepID=UPI002265E74B|nr:ABC transporter permease [Parachryseolinea silvisoli]MCD9019940.1 ABC transporter permease [Parachryseolinea silvisoli]
MIRNYLNATLRTLLREKGNTFINVVGLTLGITTTLILFLIVHNGKSYDTYHTHIDRIFRIVSSGVGNAGITYTQAVPPVLPEAIQADIAGVEAVAFTSYRRGSLIVVPQPDGSVKKYEEPQGVVFTEPSFFRIFDRPLVSGTAAASLDAPQEAVISQKWARRYFGREDVVGQSVVYDSVEYSITAVMEDYPSTTDLPFDLMLSYNTIRQEMLAQGWGNLADHNNCYVLLREGESRERIEAQLPAFVKKHKGDDHGREGSFIVQPMKEVHTDRRFGNYNKKMPLIAQVTFTAVAVFMLLTACINFINLATAQAIRRTKEVGIRKVLGSSRVQLVLQLVGEAFLVTLVSTLLSMALVPVVLTFTNPFLGMSLSLDWSIPAIPLALAVLVLVVTLLAGLYPAFMVSGFRPVLALKSQTGGGASSGYTLRRSLVVFQFFIAQVFIFGTIVMARQLDFMQQQDLGFSPEAIITVPIPVQHTNSSSGGNMQTLKDELLHYSGIQQASLSLAPPSANSVHSTSVRMADQDNEISVQLKPVDGGYLDLFNLSLLAGEDLTDGDTLTGFVVNERLARLAGFSDVGKIVGEDLVLWGKRYPVKGVVKDFHTQALDHAIEPVVLYNDKGSYKNLSMKISTVNMQTTLEHVQRKWEATYPEYTFHYTFMDQQIAEMYGGERKTAMMLNVFSGIVIVISCLGLLGLVTYMANQRTKEVGIRKVLGASVMGIMLLFSKEFARLILFGFLLAAPLAGFGMHEMLKEFAYRITLSPLLFLTSLGITVVVAFVTVGYRAFRASSANPVTSLRTE